MKKSVFDPELQQLDLSSKMVSGLERVSQAFKVLLWDKAKELGLSPIQIQLLIFCAHHKSGLRNVSTLAREFNVTKPTISDAVKALYSKKLIQKEYSDTDNRSYTIVLSEAGKVIVRNTENFADPILESLLNISENEKTTFFQVLSRLLFQLSRKGVLSVQRTCYSCRFYQKGEEDHYCNLLQKALTTNEIRIDCEDYNPNM